MLQYESTTRQGYSISKLQDKGVAKVNFKIDCSYSISNIQEDYCYINYKIGYIEEVNYKIVYTIK